MVGASRFELLTPGPPCQCATRLRHAPMRNLYLPRRCGNCPSRSARLCARQFTRMHRGVGGSGDAAGVKIVRILLVSAPPVKARILNTCRAGPTSSAVTTPRRAGLRAVVAHTVHEPIWLRVKLPLTLANRSAKLCLLIVLLPVSGRHEPAPGRLQPTRGHCDICRPPHGRREKSYALDYAKHPSFDPTGVTLAADPSFAQTRPNP